MNPRMRPPPPGFPGMRSLPKLNSKKVTIIVIIVVVLLIIISGIYVYVNMGKGIFSTPAGDWVDHGIYSKGMTKSEAIAYCKKNNAELASKSQLQKAFDKGFKGTNYGWLSDSLPAHTLKSDIYYAKPEYQWGDDKKLITYCYGTIPDKVYKSQEI